MKVNTGDKITVTGLQDGVQFENATYKCIKGSDSMPAIMSSRPFRNIMFSNVSWVYHDRTPYGVDTYKHCWGIELDKCKVYNHTQKCYVKGGK